MSGKEAKTLLFATVAYAIVATLALYNTDIINWLDWFLVALGAVVVIPCATVMILIHQEPAA